MATNTYVALDKKTIANNSTTSIEFTSIPQTYTDLVVVVNMTNYSATGNYIYAQFGNGSVDTGANYSTTIIGGNGSSTASVRWSNRTNFNIDYYATPSNTEISTRILQLFNYSNTTTYKTGLNRSVRAGGGSDAAVGTWRSTSAINTIRITTDANFFASGSTFSLYGIKAEVGDSTPKATGGVVTSDSTYYYHAFTTVGNFIPSQTLSCDILTIAGGGGSGKAGGGAGGLVYTASQSLVNATSYTVLIGSGGAKGTFNSTNGVNGSNSNVIGGSLSLTAAVGGGGGGGANGANGSSGGSGGGGAYYYPSGGGTGGAGTSGQGNSGGSASSSGASKYGSAGGGGFAAAGGAGTTTGGGAGGAGTSTYSTWGSVTSTGQNVSGTYYYAGGGGGGADAGTSGAGGNGGGGAGVSYLETPNAGLANTGGGAGGNNNAAGTNGGSGLVIIRYAK